MFRQSRMTRAVALLAVLAVGVETPKGCDGGKKIDEVQDVSPVPGDKANPTRSVEATPSKRANQARVLEFEANWLPRRKVTMTWEINGKTKTISQYTSPWMREEIVRKGDIADLTVENHSTGGFLQCAIKIDGRIPIGVGNSYMHRNDAGDCEVSIVVP